MQEDEKQIKIALVGNPNCGKTTMFNELTGSQQYVGNWAGVTVEKKEGKLLKHEGVIITDLPGIYSLSPYTLEEVVSRNYLLEGETSAVLNLVDASNIERNLYLTTQLLEMGLPVAIAMNMMDIVHSRGDVVDIQGLSDSLGITMVETSALNGEGILQAAEAAIAAVGGKLPKYVEFSAPVEEALAAIRAEVGAKLQGAGERWLLVKLFERDKKVMENLELTRAERAKLESIISACEIQLDDDSDSIITNERYLYIEGLMKKSVIKAHNGLSMSEKIDAVLTNRYLALPLFAMIMFMVYYIAIGTVGTFMTDWTNDVLFGEIIQPWAQEHLEAVGTSAWLTSLVVDGIIGGIGAPIGFTPQMAVVFLLLSFLEDCGYMSRVAFIMDRIFRQFGMSGKAVIPFLVSSGCGVPGIMSSRTIENEKDRRLTIMTTTFIPCSAKLPVIALMSGAIMGGEWFMAPIMYFLGFFAVVTSSIILKKSELFAGEPAPFVMEMPAYHMPSMKTIFMHTWERIADFLQKAATVIFLCSVVMWFLASFGFVDGALALVESTEDSFIALIGSLLAPVFAPLGFNSWQAVAAAFSGFVAKEAIVSTLAILTGLAEATEEEPDLWNNVMVMFPSAAAAFSFLVFNLLDSPCLAAITAMSKEMNSRKWSIATILFQNLYAYSICLMLYQFARVFVGGEAFNAGTMVASAMFVAFLYLLFRPAAKIVKEDTLSVEA